MNSNIVTFGEILMRLSPPGNLRLRQAHSLELVYGGAEANVAIALANFGMPVQFVTRLPDNELGLSCMRSLRQHGVGSDFIEYGGERLGLYFLEVGSGNRPSQVIYDRANSSFASINESTIRWDVAIGGASWFHWSGISPALSDSAAKVTAQAVVAAREAGLTISCDLNYRHTLWQWGSTPSEIMPGLIKQCDVLSANTANLMLGIHGLPIGETPEEAADACSQLSAIYPNLKQITMTCREDTSAGEQRFTAIMWHLGKLYTSRTFSLTNIVDRIGAGDAFMAGLIYGLVAFPNDPERIIDFAAASAVIKHTIMGDANLASVEEVDRLLSPDHGFDIAR
jgi:2-dehydro-3-deoxygluconokinase